MGISKVFNTARILGDHSSLVGGHVPQRAGRRIGGRILRRGAFGFGMGLSGMIMWAEFFTWIRNAVELHTAKEMWLGTAANYATGYEDGWGAATAGERRRRPYFWQGVNQTLMERTFMSRMKFPRISDSRSGVYVGGRFMADIRSVHRGFVPSRIGRRMSGAAASRLFWGTLARKDTNIFEVMAKRAQQLVRKNIKEQELWDTGALWHSIQYGSSLAEMEHKSRSAGIEQLVRDGRFIDEIDLRFGGGSRTNFTLPGGGGIMAR